jgi:hypothetical protein
MPKVNSLVGKKYCETCDKDVATSYYSKHLQSQTHLSKVKQVSEDEDDIKSLKFEKISCSSSSSEEEVEQESSSSSEEEIEYKEESSQSSSEEEQEKPVIESSSSSEEEVKTKKVVKKVNKVEVKKEQKPKKAEKKVEKVQYKKIYEVSSSDSEEEEVKREVKGSGFIKFIRDLDYTFNVGDPEVIKEIYNDVMGFKPSKKYYMKRDEKDKLRRYLNKFRSDNIELEDDEVNEYMLNILADL